MILTVKAWSEYIDSLRAVNDAAYNKLIAYVQANTFPSTWEELQATIDYAFGVATAYGEAAAELACEMYDAMALASGVTLPAAEPAATATYGEVAKAVQGTAKTGNVNIMAGSVSRLVKMAGVDTTMQNALRDGAEWAWIPRGETCAFCIMLASNGWQRASSKALKGGHAEHIHANCDCTYAIRHDSSTTVEGYEPEKYLAMYEDADGHKWQDKLNSMRREAYAANKERGLSGALLDSSIVEEIDAT